MNWLTKNWLSLIHTNFEFSHWIINVNFPPLLVNISNYSWFVSNVLFIEYYKVLLFTFSASCLALRISVRYLMIYNYFKFKINPKTLSFAHLSLIVLGGGGEVELDNPIFFKNLDLKTKRLFFRADWVDYFSFLILV